MVGRGDRPEIRWLDGDGRPRQILRWRASPVPVPESEIAVWAASRRAQYEASGLPPAQAEPGISRATEQIRSPLPFFGLAQTMPGYGGLLTDPDGNVWTAVFPLPSAPGPQRYRVVSAGGEWLGVVEMPPGFTVLDIGRELVLGVERSHLGADAVALYRIESRGP